MASKTLISFSFSCICLAMVALADHKSTPTPRFDLNLPEKASFINCEVAYMSMFACYRETTNAYTTGQARIFMGPVCCKAAQDLNSGCWPRVFGPFNPFYPPILDIYCSRFKDGQPPIPFAAGGHAGEGEPLETGLN